MATMFSGPFARPDAGCHGRFLLWLTLLAISAVYKKFDRRRYRWPWDTAYASPMSRVPQGLRAENRINPGLTRFRSPPWRVSATVFRGSFGCPFFWSRPARVHGCPRAHIRALFFKHF
jgi:hypothetical protein